MQVFNAFLADRSNGIHDLSTDVLRMALTNVAPDASVDAVFADITEIAAGNGYTAGGEVVTITSSAQVAGLYSLVPAADIVWTAVNTMASFRYVVLYNSSATNQNLISFYDKLSVVSLTAPGTFTADVGATLITDSE